MSRLQLRLGDVFSIPIDENRVGIGQVVARYGESSYYFAVFDWAGPADDEGRVDVALSSRLLFLALSFDAKLYVGHWKVLTNRPVADSIPLPAYKVAMGRPTDMVVEDYSGLKTRPATEVEADLLPYRKTVAPVRLEKALRAKHGLGPWVEAYTDLAPDDVLTSKRLFS